MQQCSVFGSSKEQGSCGSADLCMRLCADWCVRFVGRRYVRTPKPGEVWWKEEKKDEEEESTSGEDSATDQRWQASQNGTQHNGVSEDGESSSGE